MRQLDLHLTTLCKQTCQLNQNMLLMLQKVSILSIQMFLAMEMHMITWLRDHLFRCLSIMG